MNNRKIKYARLQTEAYIPGTGSLGTVFPPNSKALVNLSMKTAESGLVIEFDHNGIHKELLVPYANVVLMDLLPEEKPAKPLKAVS